MSFEIAALKLSALVALRTFGESSFQSRMVRSYPSQYLEIGLSDFDQILPACGKHSY